MGLHFLPMFVASFLVWWAARPLMQPKKLMISWRGMILHAVRWPIILRAIRAALFKIKKPYMITPKGKFATQAPTLKTYRPFLALGMLSALAVALAPMLHGGSVPEAQMIFGISNAGFMLTICAIDSMLRIKQARPNLQELKNFWFRPLAGMTSLAVLLIAACSVVVPASQLGNVYAEPQTKIDGVVQISPIRYDMTTQQLIDQISLTPKVVTPTENIGMYSSQSIAGTRMLTPHIEHTFADWRDDHYIAYKIAQSLRSGNTPLVTIEPRGVEDGTVLLTDIRDGEYDIRINRIARIVHASKSPVYIRFAHEMDLVDLYPWGNQSPQLYIDAFVHTGGMLKKANPTNVQIVWSPAGNYGAEAYYPGDENVDVVGVTMLYDQYWYGSYVPTFASIASVRDRLKYLGKPVWVVEFGAGRASQYSQHQLIQDALSSYRDLGYDALIYLSMKDANIDGPDYTLDDINSFGSLFATKEDEPVAQKPAVEQASPAAQAPLLTVQTKCSVADKDIWGDLQINTPIRNLHIPDNCSRY